MMRLICSLLVAVALVAASPAMGQGYPLNAQGYGLNIAGGTLNITATGSTTARTLAQRAADVVNVKDWGAKCDGATNDTAAIQNAINSAAGNARVYVPPAVCMVGSTIFVPSNSHITIDGTLKLVGNSPAGTTLLSASSGSPTNIVIDGNGVLDGNRANFSSFNLQSCIYLYSASNVQITGITIQNAPQFPLNVVASSHVRISRVIIQNNTGSAEFAQGSFDCWITNSEILGSVLDYGFAFYGGVYNSGITECLVGNNAGDGITVLNDSGQPAASHDITISGNIVWGNQAAGIGVRTNAGGTGAHAHINITGNRIYQNNQGNNSGWGGVYLYNVTYVSASSNIISNDGNGSASSVGISITPSAYYVTASNNTISDEGQGSTLGVGIAVGGPYANISNNVIFDDQSTKTMAFAINGTAGPYTVIVGNILGPMIGTPMNATLANDTIATDNRGYNPLGAKTVTVPASGAAYTNAFGAPATVYISGGTISAVSVNGTQVGTGAGTYRVGPGQPITLTYSVAPTWTWMVE